MAIIILAVIIAFASYIYYHLTKYNNYWEKRNVKSPKPKFFFGNMKDAILKRKQIGVVFQDIYNMFPEEKLVGMYMARSPELLVRDLDIVKNILIKDFEYFVDRGAEFSNVGLGANLFHTDGEIWRVLRGRFTPIFTSGKLKNMMHLITGRGDMLVDYVDRVTKINPEIEVHRLVQKFTQANISACAFGLDIDTFNEEHESLRMVDQKVFTTSFFRDIEMMYPGTLRKFGRSLFPKAVTTFFYGLVKDVIAKKKGQPTNRNDFMDLMLSLRNEKLTGPKRKSEDAERSLELTDDIITAQVFIFYVAGYETSASTLGFLLYQLALNPEIQEKLVDEIKEVLQKHDGEMTLQAILDLSYMGKVFDETLRMYPIVPDIRRKCIATYKIPGTDVTVEKGTLIKIPALGIQNDPKYYPNPEVFDPERFSPENVAARHSCSYMPFGLGPRHCIGMRFAQVQSRVFLAKLLAKYRVEPTKNTPLEFSYQPTRIVLYPVGGFPCNFVERN